MIDVGGKRFATTKATLTKYPESLFTAMLSVWTPEDDGSYFIDRSPKYFSLLLDYLRNGGVDELWTRDQFSMLQKELAFYKIPVYVEKTGNVVSLSLL